MEKSRRVIFIDLARALAVVFMLYGHAVSSLLDPRYRTGTWFEVWTFQRGLTSCLFLLLSGFAFSIATARHWTRHTEISPAILKRARRFGLFIILGYALQHRLDVIELRAICSEPADYANPIEPSGHGGRKIAQAIARVLGAVEGGAASRVYC